MSNRQTIVLAILLALGPILVLTRFLDPLLGSYDCANCIDFCYSEACICPCLCYFYLEEGPYQPTGPGNVTELYDAVAGPFTSWAIARADVNFRAMVFNHGKDGKLFFLQKVRGKTWITRAPCVNDELSCENAICRFSRIGEEFCGTMIDQISACSSIDKTTYCTGEEPRKQLQSEDCLPVIEHDQDGNLDFYRCTCSVPHCEEKSIFEFDVPGLLVDDGTNFYLCEASWDLKFETELIWECDYVYTLVQSLQWGTFGTVILNSIDPNDDPCCDGSSSFSGLHYTYTSYTFYMDPATETAICVTPPTWKHAFDAGIPCLGSQKDATPNCSCEVMDCDASDDCSWE